MTSYKTVRGKVVHLGSISLVVNDRGDLLITVRADQKMLISEQEASALYDLLGDVCEWQSNAGMTENQLNRMAERDEEGPS